MFDVIIVGCGIIGASAAYELSKYHLTVAVVEKNNDIACETTKANSAIIHAGYDPEPGTLMAKLNVRGARLAAELCAKLDVPWRRTGSFVLAFNQEQLAVLKNLLERGNANGVHGLALLDPAQALGLEPELNPGITGALHAPDAAVVSPWDYALALMETAMANGASLFRDSEVTAIKKADAGYTLHTTSGKYTAKYVINAAGKNCDKIHDMVSPHEFTVRVNRGQYYLLDKSEGNRVSRVIFQCPTREGKGVLVAPTVHGNLIVGPNSEDISDPDNLATTADGLHKVKEAARVSVGGIDFGRNIRNFSGVRAALAETEDFLIKEAADAPGFIDLAGIRSPGLASAPAIAEMAAEMLGAAGLALTKKDDFIDTRSHTRFARLSPEACNALISSEPAYGRVVCRCETITEGEIIAALRSLIPPRSIDAVKRRCGAGMGRCQGGFCSPKVLEIISRELNIQPCSITQDLVGSNVLTGRIRGGIDDV